MENMKTPKTCEAKANENKKVEVMARLKDCEHSRKEALCLVSCEIRLNTTGKLKLCNSNNDYLSCALYIPKRGSYK